MGFKDAVKNAWENMCASGWVASSDFPVGTRLIFEVDMQGKKVAIGEVPVKQLILKLPNGEHYTATHEQIRYAAVLCMGVIDIEKNAKGTTMIYGTKYKVEFTDGKVAVLTVGLGKDLQRLESVIF